MFLFFQQIIFTQFLCARGLGLCSNGASYPKSQSRNLLKLKQSKTKPTILNEALHCYFYTNSRIQYDNIMTNSIREKYKRCHMNSSGYKRRQRVHWRLKWSPAAFGKRSQLSETLTDGIMRTGRGEGQDEQQRVVIKGKDSGLRLRSVICSLWYLVCCFMSLSLSVLVWKIGIAIVPSSKVHGQEYIRKCVKCISVTAI